MGKIEIWLVTRRAGLDSRVVSCDLNAVSARDTNAKSNANDCSQDDEPRSLTALVRPRQVKWRLALDLVCLLVCQPVCPPVRLRVCLQAAVGTSRRVQ